jgi:cyclopropane fatty-acyl-phospholipid synthase-like methyltransferase
VTNRIESLFPRTQRYDTDWVVANQMGPNVLWLTESLTNVMELEPGMRVLDLGCGRALSSIFLAKEFGVQVWATDLWIKPAENWPRIQEAGLGVSVFPIYAEAHALPYAPDFFDAIVSMDAFHYFGTDVHYLEHHLLRLLKPGGALGIASPASPVALPDPLQRFMAKRWYWMNSVDWWRRHWLRCPGLTVELAEAVPHGYEFWLRWAEILYECQPTDPPHEELLDLREDAGQHLGFVRMVARRNA